MNYDAKLISRLIDGAGVGTHHVDKGAAWIAEIFRDLWGARAILREIGSGASQVVPNLATVPATVLGTEAETFNVGAGSSDKWKGKIDGGSSITVTLTAGGTQSAQDVVDDFNGDSNFNAVAIAKVTFDKKIALISLSSGVTSSIEIEAVANDCYTVLGFSTGVTKGDLNLWNGHRATLVTKVGEALTEAEAMLKLAANQSGNPEPEDYLQLVTE